MAEKNFLNTYTMGLKEIPYKIRDEVKRTTFLTRHYFGAGGGSVTDQRTLDLKIQKAGRPSSEQAEWGSEGRLVSNLLGYKYVTVHIPYLYDKEALTPEMFEQLQFQEDPQHALTPAQRRLAVMALKRDFIVNKQETFLELQAKELLTTGKTSCLFEGAMHQNDYTLPTSMFINATSDPDGKLDAAGTDKLEWLRKKCKVVKETGSMPTEILCSDEVITALLNDSQILSVFDNRRIEGNLFNFEAFNNEEVAYHGYISIPGYGRIALLSYAGKYTDASGNEQYIMPAKSMLFGKSNVGNVNYGAVYDNGNGSASARIAAKYYEHVEDNGNKIPSIVSVCRQTSPIVAPISMGGWAFVSNAIA